MDGHALTGRRLRQPTAKAWPAPGGSAMKAPAPRAPCAAAHRRATLPPGPVQKHRLAIAEGVHVIAPERLLHHRRVALGALALPLGAAPDDGEEERRADQATRLSLDHGVQRLKVSSRFGSARRKQRCYISAIFCSAALMVVYSRIAAWTPPSQLRPEASNPLGLEASDFPHASPQAEVYRRSVAGMRISTSSRASR